MLETGLLLMAVAVSTATIPVETPWWHMEIREGVIHSLRYDAKGSGAYGRELAWKPLAVYAGDSLLPLAPGHVTVRDGGRTIRVQPQASQARLDWHVDCSPEGYYDQLTGDAIATTLPETPALLAFISGGKGHCTVIEAFKRMSVERVNSGDLFLGTNNNPGHSTIIRTVDGVHLQVSHRKGAGARFTFENDRLVARFSLSDNGLEFRAYDADEGIRLDGGEQLPRFTFGNNLRVENSRGGTTSLNRLFNDFYLQAAFWYPGGHGISAWSAWGGQGHAYMNSPYRIDSRDSLMTQIIADDGHGRDGYAWTWGDRRGWPFPIGYDTRHFDINAMHIVGVQAHLGWSGEYDLVSGVDFGLSGHAGDKQVFAQTDAGARHRMVRGQTYSQAFSLTEPIDRLTVNLHAPPVDLHGQDVDLDERREYPPDLAPAETHLPQRIDAVEGAIVAQRFTPDKALNTVGVFTCTWDARDNRMRLRVFQWRKDYAGTLAGEPLGMARIADVKNNGFTCVLLDKTYPAGAELLLVTDEPQPPVPGQEPTAGFWHYPAPEGFAPLLEGGRPMDGRAMRIVSGIRRFPQARIRIQSAAKESIYDHTHDISGPENTSADDVSLAVSLEPGEYTISLVSEGSLLYWNGSRKKTALGGTARYNGHSWNWLERCRRVMKYQLEVLHGSREHILLLDGNHGDDDHSGISGESVGNNYYDILPFGYLDAYANAWFFDSLRALGELEAAYGHTGNAQRYRTMQDAVKTRYNDLFWTESGHVDNASRYIGCIDASGTRHDYGFSFVNTLAASVGLAELKQGRAIIDWLDNGHAYNPAGDREDLYHFQFGPRTTTIDNPSWWAVHQRYEAYPWGEQIQNGGANLYESYYDLQTRLFARGPDNAWTRLLAILHRYAEPDRLTGGSPLYTGESVQGGDTAGATGVMSYEFPETAMLAAIVVYGFLGASAEADGLRIQPRLPHSQPFIRADNLYYHGTYFDIEAHHDRLLITARPNEERFHYRIGDNTFTPPFSQDLAYHQDSGILISPEPIKPNE